MDARSLYFLFFLFARPAHKGPIYTHTHDGTLWKGWWCLRHGTRATAAPTHSATAAPTHSCCWVATAAVPPRRLVSLHGSCGGARAPACQPPWRLRRWCPRVAATARNNSGWAGGVCERQHGRRCLPEVARPRLRGLSSWLHDARLHPVGFLPAIKSATEMLFFRIFSVYICGYP
jgi:hypothetical protein